MAKDRDDPEGIDRAYGMPLSAFRADRAAYEAFERWRLTFEPRMGQADALRYALRDWLKGLGELPAVSDALEGSN